MAEEAVLQRIGIRELKLYQRKIYESIVSKEDCLAILPTGYGKSLPYQLYIAVKRELDPECMEKVIVCCPLLSLMQDQVQRMEKFVNVKAAFKGNDLDTNKLIEAGKIHVIFSSPESLMSEDWVRNLQNVSLIVIDEFHTVATWGGFDKDKEDKVFRKWFRGIGELRSIFPEANVLAMSATCTLPVRHRVLSILNMRNATTFEMSPNRVNIKYVVHRTGVEISDALFGLVESLSNDKEKFPRTVLYCNSIQDVSKVYCYIETEVEGSHKFIDMYHSETTSEKKSEIVERLSKKSELRLVIATSALGMGVDIVDCYCVILYGPPKDIIDFLQETGRCGRDGKDSVAIIMCNRYQLGHVSDEVKNVVKTTDCRRESVLKNFVTNLPIAQKNLHSCCDICALRCTCGACVLLPVEKLILLDHKEEEEINGTEELNSSSDTIEYEYESD